MRVVGAADRCRTALLGACVGLGVATMALDGCGAGLVRVGGARPLRWAAAAGSPDEVFGRTVDVHALGFAFVGELVGCDEQYVYIRPYVESPAGFGRIAWHDAELVRVGLAGWGPAAIAWTVLGTLSTLSHGWFLILSVPIWSVVGGATTAIVWSPGVRASGCAEIRAYARFPQGLPRSWLDEQQGMPAPRSSAPPGSSAPPWSVPASGAP